MGSYFIYIVRLDDKVLNHSKFIKMNPNYKEGKPCFYIGQTVHDPDIRFKQHKQGYKANKYVKKYGLYLSRRRYERYNPFDSRQKVEEFEKEITLRLRQKGYGVWSN